MIKEKP
jgi:hypothetical protein